MSASAFAFEVQLVELTARYLWKAIRPFVRRRLSRRCAHCILSETNTPLNQRGLCGECETHLKQAAPPHHGSGDTALLQRLDELLRAHEGSGPGSLDALVLFSGGKDSTYLLHRTIAEHPRLRVATLLVDNGYMSPFALANAERVRKAFDVPHITIKPQQSFVDKTFAHALTHLDQQTGYSIVDELDAHVTFDHAKHLAARYEIPLILCGLGRTQTEVIFGPMELEFPMERLRAPLTHHAGIPLREVFSDAEMALWFDGSTQPADKVSRFVLPMTVWDPSEEAVIEQVASLGLLDRKLSRPLITNNALIPVIGMAEVARFGACSWEVEFAKMVRRGKSDRSYWLAIFEMLEYSTKTGRFINRTVEQTLARLGLTPEQIGIRRGPRGIRRGPRGGQMDCAVTKGG